MLKTIPQLIQEIRPNIRCLSAAEAKVERDENKGLLVDVREPAEAAERPTSGSINIPRGVLEMKLSQSHPNPETTIYVHCATGARASLSAEQLIRIGYTNVTVITCNLETICSL